MSEFDAKASIGNGSSAQMGDGPAAPPEDAGTRPDDGGAVEGGSHLGRTPEESSHPHAAEKAIAAMRAADSGLASAVLADWGADTGRNLEFARGAAERLASPALVALLESWEINGTPLGNHPAIVEVAARIGRLLAEAPGNPKSIGGERRKGLAPDDPRAKKAKSRIDELMKLMHDAPATYRGAAVQKELQGLFASLHGDGPVVGGGGRTL